MVGSKSLRTLCAAVLFVCVSPLASAADPESEYEAGLRAAQELRYAQALHYFTQAAAHGHRDAMRTAGLMLLYGEKLYGPEVHRDWVMGMHLLAEAANRGSKISALVLKQVARHHLG